MASLQRRRTARATGRRFAGLRDPGIRAGLVLVGVAASGFVLFAMAWRGSAPTIYVPYQVPWVASAAVAGLALIGTALGLLSIHIGRRADAIHRAEVGAVVRAASELAEEIASGRRPLPGRQGRRS